MIKDNIIEEINKRLWISQIFFSRLLRIENKIDNNKNYSINYFKNKLKDEVVSLFLISDFNFIIFKEDYLLIVNKSKEDILIKKGQKFYNEIVKFKKYENLNKINFLKKKNFTSIYDEINFDYNFIIYSNCYNISEIKEDFLVIISINSYSNFVKFNFFNNSIFNNNLCKLVLKIFEIIIFSEKIIDDSFKEIYRNLWKEILIFFDVIFLNKIFITFKKFFNSIEVNNEYKEDSKNIQLIYSKKNINVYNIENENCYNKHLNILWNNNIQFINYNISIINNFRIWDNIDNMNIYYFNEFQHLLYNNYNNYDNDSKLNESTNEIKLVDVFNSNNCQIEILKVIEMCKELKLSEYLIKNPYFIFQFYFDLNNKLQGFLIMQKINISLHSSNNFPIKKLNTDLSFSFENETNKENDIKSHFEGNLSKINTEEEVLDYLKLDNRNIKISNKFLDNINDLHKSNKEINNSILNEFLPTDWFKNSNKKKNFYKVDLKTLKNIDDINSELSIIEDNIKKQKQEIIDLKLHFEKKPTKEDIIKNNLSFIKNQWDLNVFKLNVNQLIGIVYDIFEDRNFFKIYKIKDTLFINFIWKINFYYNINKNPYHNFNQCINVFHSWNYILNLKKSISIFKDIDLFSILIASLGHDIGHTGFNNDFEINTKSYLSTLYNDLNPLENYHCFILFKILNTNNSNLWYYIPENYEKIRKLILYTILNSDLKKHFDLLNKLQNNFLDKEIYDKDIFDLSSIYLHIADINHNSKSKDISLKWNNILNQEFTNQYKKEVLLNIKVSHYFKDLTNMKNFHENEFKFIKYIIKPIYDIFFLFVNEDEDFELILEQLDNNLKYHNDEYKNEYNKVLN